MSLQDVVDSPRHHDESGSLFARTLDPEQPSAALLSSGRRRGTCCNSFCFVRALVTGTVGAACFLAAGAAVNDNLMWTRVGATQVAPYIFLATLVISGALSEFAFMQCARKRKHRLQTQPGRRRVGGALGCVCQICSAIALGLVIFFGCVWLSRGLSGANLDDVNPSGCPFLPQYLERGNAHFLWIIPIHDDVNISSNSSWCAQMLRLQDEQGLILGMHGVHHEMQPDGNREFEGLSVEEARKKLEVGVEVWRAAFGAAPTHFSFPGEWASHGIAQMVRDDFHMHVRTLLDGLLGRIYHCDDSFCGSGAFMCRDWAVDIF